MTTIMIMNLTEFSSVVYITTPYPFYNVMFLYCSIFFVLCTVTMATFDHMISLYN